MTTLSPSLYEYLGGRKVFGPHDPSSPLDLHELVAHGLPAQSVVAFISHSGWSRGEVSRCLGVSEKTLARWMGAPKKHVDVPSSDRLFRTAKIMALAEEVLESQEAARIWLGEHQTALGNRIPRDLLTTDVGTREVEDLLLRMEHGFLA